jgi:hypothetical protein
VKDILTVELRKLETEISLKQDAVKSKSDPETTGQSLKSSTTQTRVPTVDVKNYGMTVIITLKMYWNYLISEYYYHKNLLKSITFLLNISNLNKAEYKLCVGSCIPY